MIVKCLSPITLNNNTSWQMDVPCGKCAVCREMRAKEWSTRLLHEMKEYEKFSFVTLTYADECLPPNLSVSKDELQKFFKRLRKNSKVKNLKYFACGEYGEQGGRPHYHSILFGIGLRERDKELVRKSWKYGMINFGNVTIASIKYVTGYILKGGKIPGRAKPFQLMSKGLGRAYAIENEEYLMQNLSLTVNGYKQTLPRYYTKILNIPEDIKIEKANENEKMSVEKIVSAGLNNRAEYDIAVSKARVQREANLKARQGLRKRNKI